MTICIYICTCVSGALSCNYHCTNEWYVLLSHQSVELLIGFVYLPIQYKESLQVYFGVEHVKNSLTIPEWSITLERFDIYYMYHGFITFLNFCHD